MLEKRDAAQTLPTQDGARVDGFGFPRKVGIVFDPTRHGRFSRVTVAHAIRDQPGRLANESEDQDGEQANTDHDVFRLPPSVPPSVSEAWAWKISIGRCSPYWTRRSMKRGRSPVAWSAP